LQTISEIRMNSRKEKTEDGMYTVMNVNLRQEN